MMTLCYLTVLNQFTMALILICKRQIYILGHEFAITVLQCIVESKTEILILIDKNLQKPLSGSYLPSV